MTSEVRIGILGLGEAGGAFAADLGRAARVTGYDPLVRGPGDGFTVAPSAADAVAGADVVLAFTAGADAEGALASVLDSLRPDAVYADFSSSSPVLKKRLAAAAAERGIAFADAVLMAPVPPQRVATPVQTSGTGAERLAELTVPLGMTVQPLAGEAGEAAARKLLRSIVVKGLTGLLIESLRAAEAEDLLEWFSDHIAETLTSLTPELLVRLLEGTTTHSVRRVHEMEAAVEMILAAGGRPAMTEATVEVLQSVAAGGGLPRGKALR